MFGNSGNIFFGYTIVFMVPPCYEKSDSEAVRVALEMNVREREGHDGRRIDG